MSSKPKLKVAIVEPGYANYDIETGILKDHVNDFCIVPLGATEEEKKALLHDADAVMVREAVIDGSLLDCMKKCQVIVRYGIGVDNIDLETAASRKIYVANVPQYGADEVSTHAVALLLAVSRWVVKRDKDVRKGDWGVGDKEPIYSFREKSLGIIGFGSIARSFLEKMRPFGFKEVLIYDPCVPQEKIWEYQGTKATVEEICRNSDVISLHAPLNEQTMHIIGATELSMMSHRTILINTGRGPLIDEKALVTALNNGTIKGAGIDVFESEPPEKSHPFFQMDNVVVSDHAAWYSEQSIEELQTKAAIEVLRVFEGKQPNSWLNPW